MQKKLNANLTFGEFASEILDFAYGKAIKAGINEPDMLLTLGMAYCFGGISMDGNSGIGFPGISKRLQSGIDGIMKGIANAEEA
jgi:hypothetical protein